MRSLLRLTLPRKVSWNRTLLREMQRLQKQLR